MNDQLLEYEQFLIPEQSVRIAFIAETPKFAEIPGTVSFLSGDLLEIALDDGWPTDAPATSSGYLLELRSAHLGSAFRCRALLISDTTGHIISMRLIGNVIFEEMREFFRIDTYLPLRYIPMPDRDEKTVMRRWMELIESQPRRINNPARFIFTGEPAAVASPSSPHAIPLEYTTPVAANISGGGLRTSLPEQLKPGCKAILELYLPDTPPKIIDIIGEVLHSAYIRSEDGGRTFSTPFRFTYISETDRDAIVRHIQNVQQRQIRQIAAEMLPPDYPPEEDADSGKPDLRRKFLKLLVVIVSFIAAMVLFDLYKQRGKSEVGLIFERGLQMYLDKMSKENR